MKTYDYKTAHGFLTLPERELLKTLAAHTPKGANILNIGVEYGASLVCLHTGNPTANLVGIDLDNSKCEVPELAKLITGDSLRLVKNNKLKADLIFIDGGHSYNDVISDLHFADLSPVGSVVALHDCSHSDGTPHSSCEGVERAVNDWHETNPDWIETAHVDSIRTFKRKYAHGVPNTLNPVANVQPPESAGSNY